MKKYLQAIYQSFGNPGLYARAIHAWRGNGFVYLLVLASLTAFLLAAQFSYILYRFNRDELPHILTQIPEMTLTNGTLTTMAVQPQIITAKSHDVIAVIDTTKNQTELTKEKAALLLGKNFVLIRQADNDVRRIEYSELGTNTLQINAATIKSLFSQLQYLAFLIVPFLIGMQWLTSITLAVLAATLSYVVTAYMPEEFNFETRLRMGAIAITPPLVVNKIIGVFTTYQLGYWIILAIWVLHLYIMVIATRHYLQQHPSLSE